MAEKDKFADEVLSDDELDNVVGGNYDETSDDSKFLNIYGLCGKYTKSDIFLIQVQVRKKMLKPDGLKSVLTFIIIAVVVLSAHIMSIILVVIRFHAKRHISMLCYSLVLWLSKFGKQLKANKYLGKLKRRRTVAIINQKPFGGASEGFSLTAENFFAKICNEI